MYVHVWWEAESSNPMHFFVMNLKTGKAKGKNPHIAAEPAQYFNGLTADFIDEKAQHLADFGQTVFQFNLLETDGRKQIRLGERPTDKWILKPGSRILAEPEGISSKTSEFADNWLRC